jgi:hypothetical protein
VPTPSWAYEAASNEATGRVMEPRNLYERGQQEHPQDVQRGQPTVAGYRQAAVPATLGRAAGTPPGSESGAGISRGNSGPWERPLAPGAPPGQGDRTTQSPGVRGGLRPAHEPCGDTTNRRQHARYRDARTKRSGPRRAGGSLRAAEYRSRGGREAQATHGRAGATGPPVERQGKRGETWRAPTVTTPLQRLAEQAARHPTRVGTPLAPLIDADLLREASRPTSPASAAGSDGVTAPQDATPLEAPRRAFPDRRRRGRSQAAPVVRGWLAPADGGTRPARHPRVRGQAGPARGGQAAGSAGCAGLCRPRVWLSAWAQASRGLTCGADPRHDGEPRVERGGRWAGRLREESPGPWAGQTTPTGQRGQPPAPHGDMAASRREGRWGAPAPGNRRRARRGPLTRVGPWQAPAGLGGGGGAGGPAPPGRAAAFCPAWPRPLSAAAHGQRTPDGS